MGLHLLSNIVQVAGMNPYITTNLHAQQHKTLWSLGSQLQTGLSYIVILN